MVRLDDCKQGRMNPGHIRMDGSFAGVVTTATHCIEICMPLQYDIPVNLADLLVKEFHDQDVRQAEAEARAAAAEGSAAAASEEGEGSRAVGEGKKPTMPNAWLELRNVLRLGSDMTGELLGGTERKLSAHSDSEGLVRKSASYTMIDSEMRKGRASNDSESLRALQREHELLKVDMHATERALREMQEENERLHGENGKLEEDKQQSGIGKFLAMLRHSGDEDDAESEKKEEEAEIVDERPPKLGQGEMWLSGEFVGQVVTQKHMVDIHIPLKGVYAGNRVNELLHTVMASLAKLKTVKAEEFVGLKDLAHLFHAEYGSGEAVDALPALPHASTTDGVALADGDVDVAELQAAQFRRVSFSEKQALPAAEPQEFADQLALKDALESTRQALRSTQGALQRRDDDLQSKAGELRSRDGLLDRAAQELQDARSETLRFQCEAEKLRAKGLAQAQMLEQMEASATQLKGQLRNLTLRQAAASAGIESGESSLSVLSPSSVRGLHSRVTSPADAQTGSWLLAAARAQEQEFRAPISPFGSVDGGSVAALRAAGQGGQTVLPDVIANPAAAFQRVTQEAAKEHKALVQDLKELERWAKELRTLSS